MEKEFKLVSNELELILNGFDVLLNGLKIVLDWRETQHTFKVELKSTFNP